MKIKDLKNDKNLVTIEIELDEADQKKLENTSYLQQRSALSPYFNWNLSKDNIEEAFGDGFLKAAGIELIVPKLNKFIDENNDDIEFLVKPAYEDLNTDENFSVVLKAVEKPEIELFNYKEDLKYPPFIVSEDTDIKVEQKLEDLRQKNVRLEPSEKPFEKGNTVSVDITHFNNDGEVIYENNNQIITSDEFESHFGLDDFIGKNIDDEITQDLPDRQAKFKINQIYNPELPELDDDFAMEVSEFDTIDEFKDSLRNEIIQEDEDEYKESISLSNVESLLTNSELVDSNEELIDYQKSDNYSKILTALFNDIRGKESQLMDIPQFEESFDANLIFEIINKVLEQENVNIEDQVESEYELIVNEEDTEKEYPKSFMEQTFDMDQSIDENKNYTKEALKRFISFQEFEDILNENTKFVEFEE